MISDGESGWEDMLPEGVSELIKSRNLFGYQASALLEADKQYQHYSNRKSLKYFT